MNRSLFGVPMEQESKSGYLDATILVNAGNAWREVRGYGKFNITAYFNNKGIKEFMDDIEKKTLLPAKREKSCKRDHQWVHPLLFIDIALTISPEVAIETCPWLYDSLTVERTDSEESYKKMAGALYRIAKDKRNFPVSINKVLALISKKVGVKNWKKATPFDIKLRDKIYDNISLTSSLTKDGNTAVRVGIVKGFEEMGLDNPFLVSQRKA